MMASTTKEREIVVTRVIDAPRDLVFAAWTERKHMEKWWLPKDGKTLEMTVRPGSVWRYSQPGRDGVLFPFRIKFIEIDKPARLVYDYWADLENSPDVRTNVTFEEENGKTKVTLHLLFVNAAEREKAVKYGAIVGTMQALENLADHLAQS